MNDVVVDSSVVAKWVLPEPDSTDAERLLVDVKASGGRLLILDLVFPEVANAIWKRHRQGVISREEAKRSLEVLEASPVDIERAAQLLTLGMEIGIRYDRAIYDSLFVALASTTNLEGITADERLYNAVHADFPKIILLRDLAKRTTEIQN